MHIPEQDITMREISGRQGGRDRERGIIGQNNGQPFRDNDELALDFAYMHYGIPSLSSKRRFMKSGRIPKSIISEVIVWRLFDEIIVLDFGLSKKFELINSSR